MDFYGDFYADFDRQKAADMLARLGLSQELKVSQMSKGMKEKVQLILVMSRKAKLYLLDEPSAASTPPRATTSSTPSSATTARTRAW